MKEDIPPLSGIVEIDDTYVGGRKKNSPGHSGRGSEGKTIIFGTVERKGRIKLEVVPNLQKKTVAPILQNNVEPGTKIMTDEFAAYKRFGSLGYSQESVTHKTGEYVRGEVHTNSIEGFWSQLKRSITGTYHSVSRQHLGAYADVFAFRYSHRADLTPLPVTLFSSVARQV